MLIDTVAALIGKNGSGKSLILRSIFQQKLKNADHKDLRVVCFSSGQNENYSAEYKDYLGRISDSESGFNHDCYYYDKEWSKLLIFLALVINPNGSVGEFFRKNSQYFDSSNGKSIDPEIEFLLNVDSEYLEKVKEISDKVLEGGDVDPQSANFLRVLEQLIEKEVSSGYKFEETLSREPVSVSAKRLREILIESDKFEELDSNATENSTMLKMDQRSREEKIAAVIYFFTEAAYGNRFIDKKSISLNINMVLEMDEMSDGEFQLLFLMALIDLFDADNTLFLFDEADSHLHYSNIELLWSKLHKIKGWVITTTHMVDSISAKKNGLKHLYLVKHGKVIRGTEAEKLHEELGDFSRFRNFQFDICSKFKYIAVIESYDDWLIFTELAKKCGCDTECSEFQSVHVIVENCGYRDITQEFAKCKVDWVSSMHQNNKKPVTKGIFLISDRDEAPLEWEKENGVAISSNPHKVRLNELWWEGNSHRVKCFMLVWPRRDMKNYLLSRSAIDRKILGEIDNEVRVKDQLKLNDSGDNESIQRLYVKNFIDPLINVDGKLCPQKLKIHIDKTPRDEISVDIPNMFNFILDEIRKLEGMTNGNK